MGGPKTARVLPGDGPPTAATQQVMIMDATVVCDAHNRQRVRPARHIYRAPPTGACLLVVGLVVGGTDLNRAYPRLALDRPSIQVYLGMRGPEVWEREA
jgi:hypothetical protein